MRVGVFLLCCALSAGAYLWLQGLLRKEYRRGWKQGHREGWEACKGVYELRDAANERLRASEAVKEKLEWVRVQMKADETCRRLLG